MIGKEWLWESSGLGRRWWGEELGVSQAVL